VRVAKGNVDIFVAYFMWRISVSTSQGPLRKTEKPPAKSLQSYLRLETRFNTTQQAIEHVSWKRIRSDIICTQSCAWQTDNQIGGVGFLLRDDDFYTATYTHKTTIAFGPGPLFNILISSRAFELSLSRRRRHPFGAQKSHFNWRGAAAAAPWPGVFSNLFRVRKIKPPYLLHTWA